MKVFVSALLGLLLFTGLAHGQKLTPSPVKLTEINAQPGRLVKLAVDLGAVVPANILWDSPSDAVDLIESETGKWAIFSSLTPGVYKVSAWASVDNKVFRAAWYRVTVGGIVPPVPPTPPVPPGPLPPDPGPNPSPITAGKRFLVVIEESADAVPNRGSFFRDPALLARMKEKGHAFRVADKDVKNPAGQTPADLVRFLNASAGKALPQLFITDEKGNIIVQTNMPALPADLLVILGKAGG